jgi:hypothetical protein
MAGAYHKKRRADKYVDDEMDVEELADDAGEAEGAHTQEAPAAAAAEPEQPAAPVNPVAERQRCAPWPRAPLPLPPPQGCRCCRCCRRCRRAPPLRRQPAPCTLAGTRPHNLPTPAQAPADEHD